MAEAGIFAYSPIAHLVPVTLRIIPAASSRSRLVDGPFQ